MIKNIGKFKKGDVVRLATDEGIVLNVAEPRMSQRGTNIPFETVGDPFIDQAIYVKWTDGHGTHKGWWGVDKCKLVKATL